MGACKSKGTRERDLGDDGEDVTFSDDPIRELYELFETDFALDNSEVLLLASMIKSRRLDKMATEAQALVVQRDATEESCALDYMIQHISEQSSSGTDVVISFKKFEAVVGDCFEPTDVQTAIEQMRTLRTQRQIQMYGTMSIKVGRPAVKVGVERSGPREVSTTLPLARLYRAGPEPDTSEEPTDEVPA